MYLALSHNLLVGLEAGIVIAVVGGMALLLTIAYAIVRDFVDNPVEPAKPARLPHHPAHRQPGHAAPAPDTKRNHVHG